MLIKNCIKFRSPIFAQLLIFVVSRNWSEILISFEEKFISRVLNLLNFLFSVEITHFQNSLNHFLKEKQLGFIIENEEKWEDE